MDMVSILNKIREIDNIKHVIFDENQLNLFNSFDKDTFLLDKENVMVCSIEKRKIEENVEKNKLETALISLKSQKNLSNINERLLSLLEKKSLSIKEARKNR